MRPQVIAVGGAIQLRGDADAIAIAREAAFEHRVHVQLLPDAAHVFALALKGERRGSSHHAQIVPLRKVIGQLFRHAIGDVFVLVVGRVVLKRQHHDGTDRLLRSIQADMLAPQRESGNQNRSQAGQNQRCDPERGVRSRARASLHQLRRGHRLGNRGHLAKFNRCRITARRKIDGDPVAAPFIGVVILQPLA